MASLEQIAPEATVLGSTVRPGVKSSYRWWALSCTSLGTLMATLNSGTLIIALPVLLRVFHAPLLSIVWVLLAYMLAQTVLVLTAGRLADMFGRKTLYVVGFALFGVTGLAAGFCTNVTQLIVVRAIQGGAGAFMIANSSAIVTDAFPKQQLGLALGTNMIVAAVGSILGTILGGVLTNFGWQWVFWFNVPFAVLGTIWAIVNLRELSQIEGKQRFDIAGTALYVVAIVGLLLALTVGGIQGWTAPIVIIGFIAAAVTLPLFIIAEVRARQPMLDLRLFAHRPFALGNLSTIFNAMARQGVTFLFVFYFQGPLEKDPITAGLLLTPIAASMLVVSPLSGWLADRQGSRWLAFTGLLLTTVGLGGMAFIGLDTPYWYVVVTMVVMGAGSGFFNSPNSRMIMT
nr:MFS transporter [Ktedonobacterales bacterium]